MDDPSILDQIRDFGTNWSGVFMIIFMFIIAFFLWALLLFPWVGERGLRGRTPRRA